ncbi:RHS repeat-associated core domain-containing protein [Amycolatopsis pithecellobii]|uniref:Type IV secretion protein Rhs n=1 Tax=Amycolatopsis pithecellobii TaxID=664692 RepID=A0A6N7Z463_9PSEU|nr:RHS repeat-associated core domain-containing protein [Amycolatopsis pithecellobii]MTD56099.1 type IV secretion protein Rhs [Amycolatopsis pithecellobii]
MAALVAIGALVVSSLTAPAVAASAAQNKPPAVPVTPKIPHQDVPLLAQAPGGKSPAQVPAAVLPPSGNADVAPRKNTAPGRVGTMPITVAAAPGVATPAMKVHLADPATTRGAGVTGVLFSVELAQPRGGTSAPATLGVDYSRFRDLTAGFGDRARLVQLPACVLTTPAVPACQKQTPIPSSVNDRKANVVSAQVDFSPASGTSSTAARPDSTGSTSPAMVVMATTTDSGGSNGTFTASTLNPSGTWSVTGDSGQFAWSYPVAVPPAASGTTAPKVALSYSSSSVDGRTSSTNNQVSWIGEGWDYTPGYVERTYRQCSDDTTLPAAQQTPDLCWAGQIVTMNLGGSMVQLVRDDATGSWHPVADNGSRVELLTGAGNGAANGEYWKITTTDGTQYFFGRNAGPGYTNQGTTNSTWTTPVYGAHPGDPCYNAAGFAASSCTQAWRWNLDYVEDAHGNVTTYYYTPETNFYGADNGTAGVAYTRGGYLNRIDYGLRDENGTIYGNPAPDQVQFTVAERCFPSGTITCDPSQFTAANAASWPDTPQDQQCLSGTTCNNHAPSFWTTKRLTNITTRYYNGTGYTKVDSYDLAQQFSSSGDPALWLNSITRTGFNPDGTSIAMPPVSFAGQMMDNRVAGYNNQPPMARWRLTNITAETGQRTNLTYSQPECSATNVPVDPSQDTKRCFPVYWTFPYQTNPTLDYFHKYLVSSVQTQEPNALSPSQLSTYTYIGAPAWHFDDNEVVKPANRTYGQFRGYSEVDVATGDPGHSTNGHPDITTLTKTTYYRGMDGDTLPGGGHRTATVTDSLGETVPDSDLFSDNAREVQTFNGPTGPRISSTITDMATVATTATRNRAGLPALTAAILAPTTSREIHDLAAGGTHTATTTNTYDNLGRPIRQTSSGDGVPDVCTSTSYADNTTSWIRNKASETITSQQVCPAPGVTPSPILTDVRSFYDGSTTLGAVPGAGDVTRTDTATINNGGTLTFATTSSSTYDSSGRPLTTTDGLNRTSRLAYTPADGGSLTQTVTTNPLNQTSTITLDPGRGTTTSTVDVAAHRSDATYDALGRLTAVWLPGHSKATNDPASATYAYQLSATAPSAVTTKTLVHTTTTNTYITAVKIYDALGQLKQTQTDAEGGGRTVADAFYDSHGWAANTHDRYYTDGTPGTTLISVADSAVNSRTVNTYDGTGRLIDAAAYNGLTFTWDTKIIYSGDRTTTVPPAGGVTTSALTDVRGKTTETRQYTTPPTINGSVITGGTYQSTTQTYTPLGQVAAITDPGNNVWTYTYDLLGNKTHATDPATGATSYTYDIAGQLTSSTDARNQTLVYTYDNLGRKTTEYSGSTTGPKLASWVYDTVQKGKLTSSTRYTPQGNYLVGYGGYDGQGNPTSKTVQLPTSETGLSGNHTTQYEWNDAGVLGDVLPAPGGGLPGEWIGTIYDSLGNAVSSDGYNGYVSAVAYTPYGETAQISMGDIGMASWLTYDRDPQTRRLSHANYSAQTGTPQLDDTTYTYSPSGNPTRSVDVQGPNGGPTQTQCYTYDALDRLAQAWTATDNCAANPATSTIGGTQPYWQSWTFDPTGLRQTQTAHAVPGASGDTTTNYTYPAAGTPQAAALQSTATTGPGGNSSTGYTYDAAGNTLTRTLPVGNQTLTWDAENHLATDTTPAGATSYVYDADGNQLVRHDPGSTTLYLPGEELTRNTTTGTVTGTRYYTFNNQVIALRVGGANPLYLDGDTHGSMLTSYNPTTNAVTRRNLDPYGNPLGQPTITNPDGTNPGPWPDTHGFLGKPQDTNTGLTDVGARNYDSTTGRFASVDPLLTLSNPQSGNGYTYSADNPLTYSDPSGLIIQIDGRPAPIGQDWINNNPGQAAWANGYNDAVKRNWANSFAHNPDAAVNRANGSSYHTSSYWRDVANSRISTSRAFNNPTRQLLDDIVAPPDPLQGMSPLAQLGAQQPAVSPSSGDASGYHYHFTYPLGVLQMSTADQIFNRIKDHLGIFFPIPGMCNEISVGRTCSLAGSPIQIEEVGSRDFQLVSLPGHVEGAGKHISFTIKDGSFGTEYLEVRAWGPIGGPTAFCQQNALCARANANVFANNLWRQFADRVKLASW